MTAVRWLCLEAMVQPKNTYRLEEAHVGMTKEVLGIINYGHCIYKSMYLNKIAISMGSHYSQVANKSCV